MYDGNKWFNKKNNDATVFTEYPERTAKQEALDKIPDTSLYTDKEKKTSLEYIEKWKKNSR